VSNSLVPVPGGHMRLPTSEARMHPVAELGLSLPRTLARMGQRPALSPSKPAVPRARPPTLLGGVYN